MRSNTESYELGSDVWSLRVDFVYQLRYKKVIVHIKEWYQMALKRDRLSFNQNFCEVNVSFNEETTQSYIDAIERKDTKTFTDYNRLEKELDEK